MKRTALLVVLALACMSLPLSIAQSEVKNDTAVISGVRSTLSVDGTVNTKFASIGSEVIVEAMTRGHTANTVVTAEIVQHPGLDPIDFLGSNSFLGNEGAIFGSASEYVKVSNIVLTSTGAHADDPNTMTWSGTYVVPTTVLGGVYSARVIAEDGGRKAVDDSTQMFEHWTSLFEEVLQSFDDAWDTTNPTDDLQAEFDKIEDHVTANGGWEQLVSVSTEGSGVGGSQQLWDDMIDAGRNEYEVEAGADFLEALMEFLDSDDVGAGLTVIAAILTYIDEFPVPREMEEFKQLAEHALAFDPIENFTQFDNTGDFEAAYDALLGSNEWIALEQALDDLANNRKQFEAVQTILHQLALLAVSGHPEAIVEALEAWASPLDNEDPDSMTPLQKLIWTGVQMESLSLNPSEPDGEQVLEYQWLLDGTTEGQAWTTKMQTSAQWVHDARKMFDALPENMIGILFGLFEDEAWGEAIETAGQIFDQFDNLTGYGGSAWAYRMDGDLVWDGQGNLNDIRTTALDGHVADIGVEINVQLDDWEQMPNAPTMSMTNTHGVTVESVAVPESEGSSKFIGRLTATTIEDTTWSFSDLTTQFESDSNVNGLDVRIKNLRPGFAEVMGTEGADEMFVISAIGVLVDQDETTSVDAPYNVRTLSYDASGAVQGAEVDVAIIRVSPDGANPDDLLNPEGDIDITHSGDIMTGTYTGDDLEGDVEATIGHFEHLGGGEDWNPSIPVQIAPLSDEVYISGTQGVWSHDWSGAGVTGLVSVTTTGATDTGIGFEYMQQVPLPGTSGCTKSELSSGGDRAYLSWGYENFREHEEWNDDIGEYESSKSYDKPNLANMTVDWGDGSIEYYSWDSGEENPRGWEEHWYENSEEGDEYNITVQYTDENVNVVEHHYTYGVHQGVWKEEHHGEEEEGDGENDDHHDDEPGLHDHGDGDVHHDHDDAEDGHTHDDDDRHHSHDEEDHDDERHGYHTHSVRHGECYLDSDMMSTPSAEIIDRVISEGPVEVITEQIKKSDNNGEMSISVTPTLPGIYLTIAQSRITRNGATMTGIGMNAVAATKASVALSGDDLTEMTTMGGIPVYSVIPDSNGLTTLTITPTGVSGDVNGFIGIAPLEMSELFTDVDEDEWGEEQEAELEFQSGDTSRSTEMRIIAPISLVVVGIMGEDEMPLAVHAGLLLNNPETLSLTGSLGPGQTTTISLAESEAERILAVAAPQSGFDPASIDFSAFTELLWDEGAKPEINWVAAQKNVEDYCLNVDAWYDEWDSESNVHIVIREEYHDMIVMPDFDSSQVSLKDSTGATITPVRTEDGYDWDEEKWKGYYNIQAAEGDQEFTLTTQSGDVTVHVVKHDSDEEGEYHYEVYSTPYSTCDRAVDDAELIDRLFADLGSVAWGQGTSADLRLPVLASPKDQYTVIAIAQKGTGDAASVVAATGSQISIPNPLPPVIEDLTVGFSPPNPKPGDTVQITVTDPSNQPVDGMSVIVAYADGSATLFSILTDSNGQAEFAIPVGELKVKVSGGMFAEYEMDITVTDSGAVIPGATDAIPDGGQGIPGLEGNATGSSSAAGSGDSDGGFVPAPGILLTTLALMGAIFLQRSKDD